jgi:hypothetical protein
MTEATNQKFDIAAAMKGQQWERCKGELRALVTLQGSYHSAGLAGGVKSFEERRLEFINDAVETFIGKIESESLHE